jgi:hypothetical protein
MHEPQRPKEPDTSKEHQRTSSSSQDRTKSAPPRSRPASASDKPDPVRGNKGKGELPLPPWRR